MARPKKKKIADKFEIFSFAVNFCAIFSLILIVGLLIVAQNFSGQAGLAAVSRFYSANECSCDTANDSCPLAVPAVLFPVSADNPLEDSIEISMDDGGFFTKELNLSVSSSRTLEIYNKGVNIHSFKVPDLGIDTGIIIPGETKTVVLENLPQNKDVLEYRSGIADDDPEKFSGIIILKQLGSEE